jgi:hypothetical protein
LTKNLFAEFLIAEKYRLNFAEILFAELRQMQFGWSQTLL